MRSLIPSVSSAECCGSARALPWARISATVPVYEISTAAPAPPVCIPLRAYRKLRGPEVSAGRFPLPAKPCIWNRPAPLDSLLRSAPAPRLVRCPPTRQAASELLLSASQGTMATGGPSLHPTPAAARSIRTSTSPSFRDRLIFFDNLLQLHLYRRLRPRQVRSSEGDHQVASSRRPGSPSGRPAARKPPLEPSASMSRNRHRHQCCLGHGSWSWGRVWRWSGIPGVGCRLASMWRLSAREIEAPLQSWWENI